MATTTNNGWTTPDDSQAFKLGANAIRTLGSAIDTSTNIGLKAWTNFSPTYSGISIGNGTASFQYTQLGKIVIVRGAITLGTTSSITATVDISVPVTPKSGTIPVGIPLGTTVFTNNTLYYPGTILGLGGTNVRWLATNVSATYGTVVDLSATVPFTWGNTHKLFAQYMYEAA
jgi:hypothetical protein